MITRAVLILLAVSFVVQLWWSYVGQDPKNGTNMGNESQEVTVFICADSGNYSGRHELHFIYDAMVDVREVKIPDCPSAYFGYLVKSNGERLASLAVTTGIYITNAVTCTLNLMQDVRYKPASITYLGTAGISPTVGGWDPRVEGGCGVLSSRKNMLGSVCITDAAVLQECGVCVEETITSDCSRPNCVMHNHSTYFGRCAYRHPSSLAKEMRQAMEGKEFPRASELVREGVKSFWSAHQAVNDNTPPTSPTLLNCAETDTSQILAGGRSDFLCREYSHALLPDIPFEEHTCVQAMEGIGFLHVMARYPHVPIALVRAGSNYDMYPMSAVGQSSDGTPLWMQSESFMGESEYEHFTQASYRYAVLTSSAVVLNYFTDVSLVHVEGK